MNDPTDEVSMTGADDGAVSIEYALIAFLIALAISVGAIALGGSLSGFFARAAAYMATLFP